MEEEQLIKASRKGLKYDEKMVKLMGSAFRTSTMLGASVEGTADLFVDWTNQLHLSGAQASQMGRALKDVARSTGLSGD
ncbi:hypothetical protein ABTH92_21215, partial [Acinetobacter baumannii]